MLLKKLWRTIGVYRAQFLSMILMIAIGVGIFVAFNMEWKSIEKNTDSLFRATGYADFRVVSETGSAFSAEDREKIAAIEGVGAVSRFVSVAVKVAEKDNTVALTVTENENVSGMLLRAGAAYDKNDIGGIWLSDKYAEANGVTVGDTLTLTYEGTEFRGTVRGLVKSGEYLVCVPESGGQIMPDFHKHGFAFISPAWYAEVTRTRVAATKAAALATAAAVATGADAESDTYRDAYRTAYDSAYSAAYDAIGDHADIAYYAQVHVKSDMEKKAFSEAVNDALGRTSLILSRDESTSYAAAKGESDEGKTMALILPVLFLLIAVLTMVTTMHRLVAKEKTQIGTLKALGFRDKKILWHYTSFGLIIGIIGITLGVAIGFPLARVIMSETGTMGTYFDMPDWKLWFPGFCYPVLAVVLALLVGISYLSTREMLRGTAADALRPYTPKRVKPLLIERTRLFHKLSFGTRWNLRDTMRHKARTAMSLIGVVGCMLIVTASMGMRDTMSAFLDSYYTGATNYATRIYLAEGATDAEREAVIGQYDGDASASVSVELFDEKPVSLDIYRITHDKVRFPADKKGFLSLPHEGVYICRRIADEYGLRAGDKVKISPYGTDEAYELTVAAVIRSVTEGIILSDKYADSVGITYHFDSVYTDAKGAEVAPSPTVSSTQSKEDIVASFDSMTGLMNLMIALLAFAAALLGAIVLYNLGVMSYTERYREMATLKVVGFRDRRIGGLLIGQNMGVTLVGMMIGLPLGIWTLGFLLSKLASEYEMRVSLGPLTFIVSILVTAGTSLLVSLLVARKNRKIDMVEALKGAE